MLHQVEDPKIIPTSRSGILDRKDIPQTQDYINQRILIFKFLLISCDFELIFVTLVNKNSLWLCVIFKHQKKLRIKVTSPKKTYNYRRISLLNVSIYFQLHESSFKKK